MQTNLRTLHVGKEGGKKANNAQKLNIEGKLIVMDKKP